MTGNGCRYLLKTKLKINVMTKNNPKTMRIRDILTRMPETRNDPTLLIIEFWRLEQPTICKFGNAERFMREFASGKFTMPETITRIGRMVQNNSPELRRDESKFIDRRTIKNPTT